jgi:hypothetical protein
MSQALRFGGADATPPRQISTPATIHLAPMPDPDDDHNKSVVVHFVQYPVIADTQSIAMLAAAELRHT